jgi:hypothetical protein
MDLNLIRQEAFLKEATILPEDSLFIHLERSIESHQLSKNLYD